VVDVAVVYESLFGNTQRIAEAIAEGLRAADPDVRVAVVRVADATADMIRDVRLLIVGAPTHMLGMSRESSRRKAATVREKSAQGQQGSTAREPDAAPTGVREWLAALPKPPRGRSAAAFDTRLAFPLAGGAARFVGRGLRRLGYRLLVTPQGFIVDGTEGPLRDGECDRAKAWGADLLRTLAAVRVH
jgi:hypothetical protein